MNIDVDQDTAWVDSTGSAHVIATMGRPHARNAAAWLEAHATQVLTARVSARRRGIEVLYVEEQVAKLTGTLDELLGILADPQAAMRATPLHQALTARGHDAPIPQTTRADPQVLADIETNLARRRL